LVASRRMRYDRPKGGAKVSTAFRQLDKNMLCSFY
jgi:hypothetical protein